MYWICFKTNAKQEFLAKNYLISKGFEVVLPYYLKTIRHARKVSKVLIKSGAVINPGAIVIAGVTIGENSIISPRSVVTQDIPDYCIAVGNPARVIKKINH